MIHCPLCGTVPTSSLPFVGKCECGTLSAFELNFSPPEDSAQKVALTLFEKDQGVAAQSPVWCWVLGGYPRQAYGTMADNTARLSFWKREPRGWYVSITSEELRTFLLNLKVEGVLKS